LVNALRARLLTAEVLHADETPVAQLDPGAGKTKRAYLFAYRSPDPQTIVIFDYCPTRAGKHAADFLGQWQGALMVDDYGGNVAAGFMLRKGWRQSPARGSARPGCT
jgi:transposase